MRNGAHSGRMPHSTVQMLRPGPTLIEQAYEAILEAICSGRLAAGERLNQDALAARLGISRQPVGQALSVLKAQGFVRETGRRGLIVAPLEREFFRAIYELREALDSLAASLAAQRCQPADVGEGRKLLAEGRRAARAGRVEALIEADMRFHLWICRVAGNQLLTDTMRLYWNHLRRAMGEVLQQPARRNQIWDEHEALLHGIIQRDPAAAAHHATVHARAASKSILGLPAAPPSARQRSTRAQASVRKTSRRTTVEDLK
jgi:DNA-binding GntR family transcriptional regulator